MQLPIGLRKLRNYTLRICTPKVVVYQHSESRHRHDTSCLKNDLGISQGIPVV